MRKGYQTAPCGGGGGGADVYVYGAVNKTEHIDTVNGINISTMYSMNMLVSRTCFLDACSFDLLTLILFLTRCKLYHLLVSFLNFSAII